MMRHILLLITITLSAVVYGQKCDSDSLYIKTPIYEVVYSEILEQPIWVKYSSTNLPKGVDRGSMNFHPVDGVCTSDNDDYYQNIYDKGHLAPAATFSDTYENLYLTFSYLNCSVQNQYLNRGEWRLLESQERVWDDNERLDIEVIVVFDDPTFLPTGSAIPTAYHKHIYFTKQKKRKCYYFLNEKPTTEWEDHDNTLKCKILH